jgi:eukaryotic-like serine/threonine-protein kinase
VRPGTRLGKFLVVHRIGEGASSVVYRARHVEIGHLVALKVLRAPMVGDEQAAQRFVEEARAANAARHPNIAGILDVGRTPDGEPYLVMEYLRGETLARRIARVGRLSVRTAVRIAHQAAAGTWALHKKGTIHRDLKPANLFLVEDDATLGEDHLSQVKVLDFGIARLIGPTRAAITRTPTAAMVGTPFYISPEQWRCASDLDERTDAYSLGVVIYEMLCGRVPFLAGGVGEIADMHLHHPVPDPRATRADLPAALAELVVALLAKSPDGRPPTMRHVRESLKDIGRSLASSRRLASSASPQGTLAGY